MVRDSIVLIGDAHTVNAFRICGIESFVSDPVGTAGLIDTLLKRDDIAVIAVTAECGASASDLIRSVNLNRSFPVMIEIPGVDTVGGFDRSLISYITEALGVAI